MALLNWNQPYAPNLRTGHGGYYELGGKSGLVGPTFASGAILFACQFKPVATLGWTPRMQLKWLKINALTTTAFGAAQAVDLQLFKCRGFTAADSAGSALVPAAGDQKKQSGYSNSLFVGGGDIRIAATATLTAGTRTPRSHRTGQCHAFLVRGYRRGSALSDVLRVRRTPRPDDLCIGRRVRDTERNGVWRDWRRTVLDRYGVDGREP